MSKIPIVFCFDDNLLMYNRENKISIFFKQNIQKNNTFELKYNG